MFLVSLGEFALIRPQTRQIDQRPRVASQKWMAPLLRQGSPLIESTASCGSYMMHIGCILVRCMVPQRDPPHQSSRNHQWHLIENPMHVVAGKGWSCMAPRSVSLPWMALMRTAFICLAVVDAACLEKTCLSNEMEEKWKKDKMDRELTIIAHGLEKMPTHGFSCTRHRAAVSMQILPRSLAALFQNTVCWKAPAHLLWTSETSTEYPLPILHPFPSSLLQPHLNTDLPQPLPSV